MTTFFPAGGGSGPDPLPLIPVAFRLFPHLLGDDDKKQPLSEAVEKWSYARRAKS
jgi:hypothetical protein